MVSRVRRSRRTLVFVSVVLIAGVCAPAITAVDSPAASASASALDHFECYDAAATTTSALRTSFRAKPNRLRLKNHFAAEGFVAALGNLHVQCSPTRQTDRSTGHAATSSITNPNARLVCWTITTQAPTRPGAVTLRNEFGAGVLEPTAARSLCLPSWKNGATPLKFPSSKAPTNLDSYICYTAIHPAGSPSFDPPSSVVLKDQFGATTARLGAANIVCAPTARYVNAHGAWTSIVNPATYTVCFAISVKAAVARTAYDKNQFGTGAVRAGRTTELCVPSAADPPPPSTTTTAPITSTTAAPVTTTTTPAATTTTAVSTTTVPSSGGYWTPSAEAPISWYWQLQGTVNLSQPAQVYEVDGFRTAAATVAALHQLGKKVVCYIDFGTAENTRPDFGSFPALVQGLTNTWPGETWLDIRQLGVLEPIMTARMQMCVQKGFDAVEADNVDGYQNVTGFPLTALDQLTYNMWIATSAHSLGLSIGLKNDNNQAAQLAPYFDWALDEQCNQYSQCATESAFTQANKAVFQAEYVDNGATTAAFCPADAAAHLNGALFGLALDGATYQPCAGSW